MPTRFGVYYFMVLAGMLVGSANYNNNLGFLLTFLLAAVGVAALFQTHANLAGLKAPSCRAEPVFAGQTAAFEISVRADGQDRFSLDLWFEGGAKIRSDVSAGDTVSIRPTVKTERRGRFLPGPIHLETVFPLGLFRTWKRLDAGAEVLVYPQPASGPVDLPPGGDGTMSEGASRAGEGVDDFKELRAYQHGILPGASPGSSLPGGPGC